MSAHVSPLTDTPVTTVKTAAIAPVIVRKKAASTAGTNIARVLRWMNTANQPG